MNQPSLLQIVIALLLLDGDEEELHSDQQSPLAAIAATFRKIRYQQRGPYRSTLHRLKS